MGTGARFSAVPNKTEKTMVLESCAQHWCWELQLDSLEEQYMILTSGPSLQPNTFTLKVQKLISIAK